MPIKAFVGQRLRARLDAIGMTREDLAAHLRVDPFTVALWERGRERIPPDTLGQIAEVLDVPIRYFFEDLPDPPP